MPIFPDGASGPWEAVIRFLVVLAIFGVAAFGRQIQSHFRRWRDRDKS